MNKQENKSFGQVLREALTEVQQAEEKKYNKIVSDYQATCSKILKQNRNQWLSPHTVKRMLTIELNKAMDKLADLNS